MPKITEMFAFVAHELNDPDDEGIMAFQSTGGQWMPMIGADMPRIESLISIANIISKRAGKPYRILHFKLEGEICQKIENKN